MAEPIMRGTARATIAAPPEQVYELVAQIERTGEWSPECQKGEWLEDGTTGPQVGQWFTGHNKIGSFEWQTRSEVVAAEAGRELAWTVGGRENPLTTWRYTFEANDEGGTDVVESFVVHQIPPPLKGNTEEQLRQREMGLVLACQETLANLKRAAEGAA